VNDLRPSSIAAMAGGAALLIASFLDWFSVSAGPFSYSSSLWDFGLQGFFMLVIAAIIIAVPALASFAPQVKLPEQVLGFSRNQIVAVLGFTAFLISFSILFRSDSAKIGTILSLLGSIAVLVGAYMEMQAEGAPSEPPRTI
jgi:hypothetical protein